MGLDRNLAGRIDREAEALVVASCDLVLMLGVGVDVDLLVGVTGHMEGDRLANLGFDLLGQRSHLASGDHNLNDDGLRRIARRPSTGRRVGTIGGVSIAATSCQGQGQGKQHGGNNLHVFSFVSGLASKARSMSSRSSFSSSRSLRAM